MIAVRMLLKLFVILCVAVPAFAFASVGKIEKVGAGQVVKVTRAGNSVRLKEGDLLEVGDELSTDAATAVDIRLADDTLIRVGVNSSYRVEESSKLHSLVHRLLSGVVRVLVKPTDRDHKDPTIKFRLQTPEGTIGVRGTEFVVVRTKGRTQLKGLDGEVLFGAGDTDFGKAGTYIPVPHGFESEIVADGGAPKVQKFDLKGYLSSINGSGGPFGPLSSRTAGQANRYVRSAVTPDTAAKPAPIEEAAEKSAKAGPVAEKPKSHAEKPDHQSLLLKAAFAGDVEVAKRALAGGANIDAPSGESLGHNALQVAMLNDKKDMFLFLVGEGADCNKVDENGLTPLMFAAVQKLDMAFAYALVDPGAADVDITNKDGKTALDLAKAKGNKDLAQYLASEKVTEDYARALEAKKAARARKSK